MDSLYPTRIERSGEQNLRIEWSNGKTRNYTARDLREHCPCATCKEKTKKPTPLLPVLTAAELAPLTVTGMKPVGNYAYAITFSDGHDSGIYTFALLHSLGS